MSRYTRQALVAPDSSRLAEARVLVVGAGGLAAPTLPLLAGAGVGHLTIVDGDVVALSNLHRQTLFAETDCGQPKAQVAAARCRALNSEITVKAHGMRLTPATAPGLLAGADLVLDCADSYAVSYLLSDLCLAAGTPLVSGSVLGFEGYTGGFCGGAPSLRALYPDAPQSGASCETAGVMGPVVTVIGAQMAQMALAILLDLEPSPLGLLTRFDGRQMRSSSFRFDRAPEPETAFRFVAASDLTDTDQIIELRSSDEAPTPLHPAALRLTPDQIQPQDRRLALCCATGLRAWRAAEQIHQTWPGEIVLVAASAS